MSRSTRSVLEEFEKDVHSFVRCYGSQLDMSYENNILLVKNPNNKSLMTIGISAAIHGDEIGGIEALQLILKDLCQSPNGISSNMVFIIGNPDAVKSDSRYIDADLNRSFLSTSASMEKDRADVIKPYLQKIDLLIDLHETIEPSASPFFISDPNLESLKLAYALKPDLPYILVKASGFSSDGVTIAKYCRLNKTPSITVELGPKGRKENINLGKVIVKRALEITPTCLNTDEKELNTLHLYHEVFRLQNLPDLKLVNQLENFTPIAQRQVLANHNGVPVESPVDGWALFPKYGPSKKSAAELLRIIQRTSLEEASFK